jgi:hypothetical protein
LVFRSFIYKKTFKQQKKELARAQPGESWEEKTVCRASRGSFGVSARKVFSCKRRSTPRFQKRFRAFRAASASRGDLSSAFEAALNSLDKERNKKETWAVRNVEQWPDLKEKGYLPSDV